MIRITNTKQVNPTIQQDVTADRAMTTVYQNLENVAKFCEVTLLSDAAGRVIEAWTGPSAAPGVLVCSQNLAVSGHGHVSFIVLPKYYYKVISTAAGPTLHTWIEWM